MSIIRITLNCPITGSKRTTIYKKNCFGKKLLYDYGFELTEFRTIGLREPHLGPPSVAKLYGDSTYKYIYINYLL